jgi:3-methyladenine DNA glycosylase/8-oxoguanine DNA glycosylase
MNNAPYETAIAHLRKADPVMGDLMAHCGPCTLEPGNTDAFVTLYQSIISQQLSGRAASTLTERLEALFASGLPTPEGILALPDETLRGLGLSRQKQASLKDLASKMSDGTLQLAELAALSDDEVMRQLTQVRGIGVWTAEMFLIFFLGRLDVFPVGDLGIRRAIQRVYGYKKMPAMVTMHRHARKWVPYRTIATWYLWESYDGLPSAAS